MIFLVMKQLTYFDFFSKKIVRILNINNKLATW